MQAEKKNHWDNSIFKSLQSGQTSRGLEVPDLQSGMCPRSCIKMCVSNSHGNYLCATLSNNQWHRESDQVLTTQFYDNWKPEKQTLLSNDPISQFINAEPTSPQICANDLRFDYFPVIEILICSIFTLFLAVLKYKHNMSPVQLGCVQQLEWHLVSTTAHSLLIEQNFPLQPFLVWGLYDYSFSGCSKHLSVVIILIYISIQI